MSLYEEILSKTEQKFNSLDFVQGDVFSEMFSHWKVIVSNVNGKIKTIEGNSKKLTLREYESPEDFKFHCSYKNSKGYWIDFMGNNPKKCDNFIEAYIEQQDMTIDEVREFKFSLILR